MRGTTKTTTGVLAAALLVSASAGTAVAAEGDSRERFPAVAAALC